jgi:hypothetical protein
MFEKKSLRRFAEFQKLLSQQQAPYYKPMYAGRQTKKAIQATRVLHRYALSLQNQEEIWAWFHEKPDSQ